MNPIEPLEPRTLFDAGDPDLTFGPGGVVTFPRPTYSAYFDAAFPAAGGTFLAVSGISNTRKLFTRYLPDGRIDGTFPAGGTTGFQYPFRSETQAIARQHDGKLLILYRVFRDEVTRLVRISAKGMIDTSFGRRGRAEMDVDAGMDALLVLPDGKVLVGGARRGADRAFVLRRLNADGSPDRSFGERGEARIPVDVFPPDDADGPLELAAIVRQSDGRIVLVGSDFGDHENDDFIDYGARRIGLTRLSADGQLDRTFGRSGFTSAQLAEPPRRYGDFAFVSGASLHAPDDAILVAATAGKGPLLYRFNPDGTPDAAFGESGRAEIPAGGALDGHFVFAPEPDGDIVVAVTKYHSSPDRLRSGDVVVGRLEPNGSVDESFGRRGFTRVRLPRDQYPVNLHLQPDDGVLVFAASGPPGNGSAGGKSFVAIRLLGSGRTEPAGTRRRPLPVDELRARAAAITDRDRLVVPSNAESWNPTTPAMTRAVDAGPRIVPYLLRRLRDPGISYDLFARLSRVVGRILFDADPHLPHRFFRLEPDVEGGHFVLPTFDGAYRDTPRNRGHDVRRLAANYRALIRASAP